MALTGTKRSLTLIVTRRISGEVAPGYPRTYFGYQSFEYKNETFSSISEEEFSLLSNDAYEKRKLAFIGYVESQEPGLQIETMQTNQPILS